MSLLLFGGSTTYTLSPSGAVAPAGALATQRMQNLALAGSLATAGQVTRVTNKAGAGALPTAGTLSRLLSRSLAAAIASASTATQDAARSLDGTVASDGELEGHIIFASGTFRAEGDLATDGELSLVVAKALDATVDSTGALSRLIARFLAGDVAAAGAVPKVYSPAAPLTATIGLSGIVVPVWFDGTLRYGVISPTGALQLVTLRHVSGSVTPSGITHREMARRLVATLSPTAVLSHEGGTPVVGSNARVSVPGFVYSGRT